MAEKVEMFGFTKRVGDAYDVPTIVGDKKLPKPRPVTGEYRLPLLDEIPRRAREALLAMRVQVTHLAWEERTYFGRKTKVLLCWLCCRQPLRWDGKEGKWKEDVKR